ncbi:hypothetical protein QO002_002146 [Pararhizobium capsulatum DSM 1112]|uniref:Lipoprotein n=1 Tax=Pararhizobium capsulatum DSM 1112 TaxID=1121113 RepID=A0ABU0BP26_9HYPH|nr:hypothetical protein [Pararhizobium capsulatum]MDQ0320008.1 hypothetical protein [Pararhizobium capsulatum DSM 1112]
MKRLIPLIPILIVAGCQSDATVRSNAPMENFKSSKSADAAVTCLVPSLAQHYKAVSPQRFVAQTIAPGKEYDVVPTDGMINGYYTYTINVKGNGSGSTLSIYKGQSMLPSITESIRAGVQACL